jgi:hypothetical protein
LLHNDPEVDLIISTLRPRPCVATQVLLLTRLAELHEGPTGEQVRAARMNRALGRGDVVDDLGTTFVKWVAAATEFSEKQVRDRLRWGRTIDRQALTFAETEMEPRSAGGLCRAFGDAEGQGAHGRRAGRLAAAT